MNSCETDIGIRSGEPLPERLYSAKISRALWLVGFSG